VLKKIGITLNIILASILLLTHFSAQLNPVNFWPFAFLGLLYPLVLISNVLFILIWALGETKKFVFISLIAMLVSWGSTKTSFQLSNKAQSLNEVSIMTWNVKNFDFYNWSGIDNARAEMFTLIEKNRPEILCLQEFYTEDKGQYKNLKELKKQLEYKYHYFAKTYSADKNRHWGLVIFSDYKILDTGKLVFIEGTRLNSCMFMDVSLNKNQTVRVYNVHLQSNQFSSEDYRFLGSLEDDEANTSAKSIIKKLKKGYINRANQAQQVLDSHLESPYPTIICGDFNDTSVSYAYRTLSKNMNDAFVLKGNGFGKTYDNPSPFLRIDFLLFHPMFKVNDYKTIPNKLSDHFPVMASFAY
jgi:endonuclease/exonuclease/phosphatase family metal-dependent hydrolase